MQMYVNMSLCIYVDILNEACYIHLDICVLKITLAAIELIKLAVINHKHHKLDMYVYVHICILIPCTLCHEVCNIQHETLKTL